MNSIRYVALDVHRKSVRACIRSADDRIVKEQNLEATRECLAAFAQKELGPDDVVAIEATFNTWAIVDLIAPYVKRVVVSNPLATKAIAQSKIKTDKVDARVLSELLRIDYLPEVWIPDSETRELRGLCARRGALVSDLVRIKNRIHGVLARNLVPRPKEELFDAKGRRLLAGLDLPEKDKRQIHDELRLLDLTNEQLEEHDRILVNEAWKDPRVKILMTMPGVDVTVALAVIAALGDIVRFRDGDHLAGYLGLVPSTYQSGEHCYHGPITKRGNRKARWLLIQAAQHLGSHPGPLGVFFRKLERKKNRNVAVVAAARKLAVIAWHMLAHGEPYRYSQPKATQAKLARLRIRATGAKRKGGTAKGAPRSANYGTGQGIRTIPSLPEIYAGEGIPPATPPGLLKPGERRSLQECGAWTFAVSVTQPIRVPRKSEAQLGENV